MQVVESKQVAQTYLTKRLERRYSERFPLHLEVRYRELGRRSDCAQGVGTTLNVGGKGILFTTTHVLRAGIRMEISMDWPARLDGKTALRLILQGRVMRYANGEAALLIQRHEFRTQRSSASNRASVA